MAAVPSSKNRRRVEITVGHYDQLKQLAEGEGRTVTSLLDELLGVGLRTYLPARGAWDASREPHELSDKLTPGARLVLQIARNTAPAAFDHSYCGTEHLLFALVQEGEGIASHVLREAGLTANTVASAIEFIIGRGRNPEAGGVADFRVRPGGAATGETGPLAWEGPASTPRPYAPRMYKVLALALDESRQLGHGHVGTGQLLLGLIREGEGIAAGILESRGIRRPALRDATLAAITSDALSQVNTSETGRSSGT